VISPMDRGQKNGGEIEMPPTIPRIVDIQRRVAAELHCVLNRYKLCQVLAYGAAAEVR
jgi:hypothetical protein